MPSAAFQASLPFILRWEGGYVNHPGEVAMSKPSDAPPLQRRRFRVQGIVQGVGFRPTVHAAATALGLEGWVANDDLGVIGEVEGPADALDAFVDGGERFAKLRDGAA